MVDRFTTTLGSNTEAINNLADRSTIDVAPITTNTTATARTMTAAEVLSSLFVTTAAGALALTMPTAAAIIAAIPNVQIGSKVSCWVVNAGNAALTLTPNTGLTITGGHGTPTLPLSTSQLLFFVVTSLTSVTVYPVLKTAS